MSLKKRKDCPTLTHLTEDDWRDIRATADHKGIPVSTLIRVIITEYLNGEDHSIHPIRDNGRDD